MGPPSRRRHSIPTRLLLGAAVPGTASRSLARTAPLATGQLKARPGHRRQGRSDCTTCCTTPPPQCTSDCRACARAPACKCMPRSVGGRMLLQTRTVHETLAVRCSYCTTVQPERYLVSRRRARAFPSACGSESALSSTRLRLETAPSAHSCWMRQLRRHDLEPGPAVAFTSFCLAAAEPLQSGLPGSAEPSESLE